MEITTPNPPDRMQCMEVWGGNCETDKSLEAPGMRLWVHSRPFDQGEGGGDVYYVSSCASGRITRMLLADVSGHGSAVSDIAVGLRDLMRRNVNFIKQTKFVQAMNDQFSEQGGHGGFATALVCTFFAPTRSVQICSAGHPSPIVYRERENTWSFATQPDPEKDGTAVVDTPLGVIGQAEYSQVDTRLEPGDMVLFFSDAFTESLDDEARLLGEEGLLEIVSSLDASDPDALIPQLIDRVRRKHDGNLAQDDATVFLFRADGTGPSLKNNLLAPFRLFGKVNDKTDLS